MSEPAWVQFDTDRARGLDVWVFTCEELVLTVSVLAGTPLSEARAVARDGVKRVKNEISCERSQ